MLEEQWVAALLPKKVADKAAKDLCRRRHDGSARWVAGATMHVPSSAALWPEVSAGCTYSAQGANMYATSR